jgi:hypothetical protein
MRNYINVIASEAKQSILSLPSAMDCFASLAMTALRLIVVAVWKLNQMFETPRERRSHSS